MNLNPSSLMMVHHRSHKTLPLRHKTPSPALPLKHTSRDKSASSSMTPPPTNGLLGGDVISDLLDAFVGQTSKPKELNQPAGEGPKPGTNLPARKRDLASYLDGEEDTKTVRARVYPDIFAQNEVDKGGSNSFRAGLAEDTFFDSEFLDNNFSGEDWFGSTGANGADGSDGWICNGDYLDPTLDPRCYGDGFDHKLPSPDESANDSPCNSSGNQDISPIASPNTQARRSRKKRGNENFYRIKAVELQRAIRIGSGIPYMYHPTPYFLMPRYDDFMSQAVYPLPKDRGCIHIGDKRQYRINATRLSTLPLKPYSFKILGFYTLIALHSNCSLRSTTLNC